MIRYYNRFSTILLIVLFFITKASAANIGLLVVATGKYIGFVDPLLESARKFFCKNDTVTFYIFTDQNYNPAPDTLCIFHAKLGWPFDTMMRYHAYYKEKELWQNQDYVFACDADMLFVDEVGDEILGERVATIHPGFVGKRGSYEKDPHSKARVKRREGDHYFAGGFYGGSCTEFLKIIKTNADNIDDDLKRGIIAEWHDESHWNRYCIDNKPTVILSPSYCYPERWNLEYPKKLLALDKNHHEYQK